MLIGLGKSGQVFDISIVNITLYSNANNAVVVPTVEMHCPPNRGAETAKEERTQPAGCTEV